MNWDKFNTSFEHTEAANIWLRQRWCPGEGVIGPFPYSTFSYPRPSFPLVLSSKSFVTPFFSCHSWCQRTGFLKSHWGEGELGFSKNRNVISNAWAPLVPVWRGFSSFSNPSKCPLSLSLLDIVLWRPPYAAGVSTSKSERSIEGLWLQSTWIAIFSYC